MAEPTVQVPVSLPTRDEVAAEVKRVTHAWSGPSMDEFVNDPPTRKHYAIADAVLALLSQPAPTAEPRDPDRWKKQAQEMLDAAPPSIADMVPGTTFTAEGEGVPGTLHRFEVRDVTTPLGDRYLRCLTHEGRGARGSYVDPSTIRDVTPPVVTP